MSSRSPMEQYLAEHGSLTYSFRGVSMNPMLKQGRDLITVRKKTDERCRKYDVVLYRRPSGQYVLHRIVEVRDEDYVILGDNCISKEYGITDEDIIGVLTAFVRKGKTISVHDRGYWAYCHIWVGSYPLRIFMKKVTGKLRRVLKRVLL